MSDNKTSIKAFYAVWETMTDEEKESFVAELFIPYTRGVDPTKLSDSPKPCNHRWHKEKSGFMGIGGANFKCLKCGMTTTTNNSLDQCP